MEYGAFRKLGLSTYESATMVSLYNGGPMTAKELSRIANVPMGRMYSTLSTLGSKGLLEVQQSRPKRYRAIPLNRCLDAIERSIMEENSRAMERFRSDADEVMGEYKAQMRAGLEERFWSVHIGEDSSTRAILESFDTMEREMLIVIPQRFQDGDRIDDPDIWESIDERTIDALLRDKRLFFIDSSTILLDRFRKLLSDRGVDPRDYSDRLTLSRLETDSNFIVVDDEKAFIGIPDQLDRVWDMGLLRMMDKDLVSRLRRRFFELFEQGERMSL